MDVYETVTNAYKAATGAFGAEKGAVKLSAATGASAGTANNSVSAGYGTDNAPATSGTPDSAMPGREFPPAANAIRSPTTNAICPPTANAMRSPAAVIGKSLFGRNLYAFFVGNPVAQPVLLQGAIHAREWVSALFLLKIYQKTVGKNLSGGYWFVPLVNPDGALLSQTGIASAPEKAKDFLLSVNGFADFSLWKANGRAVDLNVNFPAGYGRGKSNVFSEASANYVGKFPLSEPCSAALAAFTKKVHPKMTVSFHTKGEVIYWHYPSAAGGFTGDLRLAKKIFADFGYDYQKSPGSYGGYKDWCIETQGIPAYTVELGSDRLSHPLGEGVLPDLLRRAENLISRTERALYGVKK